MNKAKGDDTLLVPVHSYPVANIANFPPYLNLTNVPVGQRKDTVIPLRCSCPVDFEFHLNCLELHHAFTIKPKRGIIPANGEVNIVVTYSPSEYSTAQIRVQLIISQFNSKPYNCVITGTSSPGLAFKYQQETEKEDVFTAKLVDRQNLSPVQVSKQKQVKTLQPISSKKVKEIEYQNLWIPVDLSNPYAVATVLNQQPGKLRIKDLRQALTHSGKGLKSRQTKEAIYELKVKAEVMKERANELQWQVHLGHDPVPAKVKQKILDDRLVAEEEYKISRGDPKMENEFQRRQTQTSLRPVLRAVGMVPNCKLGFDPYSNDYWLSRHRALKHFREAARKIIIRCRVNSRLILLKKLVENLKRSSASSLKGSTLSFGNNLYQNTEENSLPNLSKDNILPYTFPYYVPPDWIDELAPDALGLVPVNTLEVTVERPVLFFNLKIPQHYKLMGYQRDSAHNASSSYIPLKLSRPLRSGAENELYPVESLEKKVPIATTHLVDLEESLNQDFFLNLTVDPQKKPVHPLNLLPPEGLFKPPVYHPLYVLNSVPGLHAYKPPLSYCETELDFHICPLPKYIVNANPPGDVNLPKTQKKFLDRDEVIKGLMTWKKFYSTPIRSLSSTATLTSSWVPRWSDPFSTDLLPINAPSLLDSLPEEDKKNVIEGAEGKVELIPEMLNVEFTKIETTMAYLGEDGDKTAEDHSEFKAQHPGATPCRGPIPRDVREQQLEWFLRLQNNQLGSKFQANMKHLKKISSNNFLLLP
eukprot:gi/632969749/ref/XP_007901252.1/ PREDICTED: primary ciliary dyskinesia protein 1 [Callorhinchus milii]